MYVEKSWNGSFNLLYWQISDIWNADFALILQILGKRKEILPLQQTPVKLKGNKNIFHILLFFQDFEFNTVFFSIDWKKYSPIPNMIRNSRSVFLRVININSPKAGWESGVTV